MGKDDTSVEERNDKMKQFSASLTREVEEASTELVRLRDELNTTLEELQKAESEKMRLATDVEKNSHTIDMNRERIAELARYVEQLDEEIKNASGQSQAMKNRMETLQVRFSDVTRNRKNKDGELASAEENVKKIVAELERFGNKLRTSRERTVDIITDETKTRNMLIKANADMQHTLARKKRLETERRNVQSEKNNVSEKLKEAEEKAVSVSEELELEKNAFRVFNEEYTANQQKLSLLNNEKREKERQVNEIKPRRQFLEKLLAEGEGMNDSVKDILKQVEKGDPDFSGIHGVLSELVNVRQGYEESVESILAGSAHALVVDTRETAERIMAYLAKNSMGSVIFVILEELKELLESADASADEDSAARGRLDDITEILLAKEPYRSVLRAMLSGILVAASSEKARDFINENADFEGCIIGEKGEIYRKGVCRSRNYSGKETVPMFARGEKVAEMVVDEKRITAEIKLLGMDVVKTEKWLRTASDKREKLESGLREKQMEFADISSRKAAVKEKFNSLTEEFLLLDIEIEEENSVIERLAEDQKRFEADLSSLESENAKLHEAVDEAQKNIAECAQKREETLFLMSEVKGELFALRKEEEHLSESRERENDVCVRLDGEIKDKEQRKKESSERAVTLEQEIKDLETYNLGSVDVLASAEAEISEKTLKKNSLNRMVNEGMEKAKEKERQLEDARNKTRDFDIRAKELEYRRSALVEKMTDTYKVNITEIDLVPDEEVNWDEITVRVNDLKEQLEKMGEVSLGAVEEHKQLEERFQFLTKQRDDLVDSREILLKAITKINRTTRKLFMETFESIRTEFNNYFRMLFNGGKAELVLQDETNVLECGIDIIVRPPGKKLHNIMQLSGGEKAMTAIALIFAIFKVNPSPFCILDEIDAPLDESNIMRFCRVLQDFLKLSQFIIVTHNRMTIQLADVLYGITMEEKGVSKVVSVKFAEDKEVVGETPVPIAA